MLVDEDRMTRVLEVLVDDQAVREELDCSCKDISGKIRSLPPEMSPEDVVTELTLLGRSNMDWNKSDDIELKRRLGQLENDIDRMRRLKKGGVRAYPATMGSQITNLLAQLGRYGLFLVPVGELEEWLLDHQVMESKTNKRAWANSAAQRIQKLGKQPGDVWDFISSVGGFLTSRRPSVALPNRALNMKNGKR